jgi:hypothetical protein
MSNPEVNFAAAAEKAIADLKKEVDKGRKAARVRAAWNIVLSIVVVVIVLLGFQLHAQTIASCQTGNDRAAGTVAALDQLVTLLEGTHPTPAIQQVATNYEAFVATHNAQRNCQQVYHILP